MWQTGRTLISKQSSDIKHTRYYMILHTILYFICLNLSLKTWTVRWLLAHNSHNIIILIIDLSPQIEIILRYRAGWDDFAMLMFQHKAFRSIQYWIMIRHIRYLKSFCNYDKCTFVLWLDRWDVLNTIENIE